VKKLVAVTMTSATAVITAIIVSLVFFGATAHPAYAASCSLSKTNNTVGLNTQVEGVLANTSVRPTTLELGGIAMVRTSGPFGAGGGLYETTYESHETLANGLYYSLMVSFPSGICKGSWPFALGTVRAVG
jgi:hypothetical protein